jgi:serine/threonine-protein kinase
MCAERTEPGPGPMPTHGATNPAAGTLAPGLAEHPDYEIVRKLGGGGMGVVYLVHDRLMGRDEVLKVISPQIIERPEALDRFLREIRAVARLRHPNTWTPRR